MATTSVKKTALPNKLNDQGATLGVNARIQSRGILQASTHHQTHMHAILHLIGFKSSPKLINNIIIFREPLVSQESRAFPQTLKMLFQFKDTALIQTQPFPNGITILNG